MPTHDYKNADGQRLKGVTTILNLLNKPALVGWAYKRGKEGVPLYESRDKAATAGTHAHLMIEHHLKGLSDPPTDGLQKEIIDKAESCYIAYLDWEKNHNFKTVESEIPLVSNIFNYGGTIDRIGTVIHNLGIVDFKTGKDIYLTSKIQVAAYGQLWNENCPYNPVKEFHILRLGDQGDFAHHYFPSLKDEFEIFRRLVEIQIILDKTGQKL